MCSQVFPLEKQRCIKVQIFDQNHGLTPFAKMQFGRYVFEILLELCLWTLFIFSWLFTWIIDSTNNLMHRIMFFVSNIFSFQHGRKRDVKLTVGLIRFGFDFLVSRMINMLFNIFITVEVNEVHSIKAKGLG